MSVTEVQRRFSDTGRSAHKVRRVALGADAPLPLRRRRRLHRRAARRQPARGLHGRAATSTRSTMQATRARDEPLGDRVRAAAVDRRRRRADPDLHPGARAAVRRPSDARHGVRPRRAALEDRDPARDRRRHRARRARARRAAIVFGRMEQPMPGWEAVADPAPILAALGVGGSSLPVERYDLGPGPRLHRARLAGSGRGAVARHRRARRGDAGRRQLLRPRRGQRWKTRMFAPNHGVAEDPATGLGRRAARGPPRPPRTDRRSASRSRSARARRSTGRRRSTRPSRVKATDRPRRGRRLGGARRAR